MAPNDLPMSQAYVHCCRGLSQSILVVHISFPPTFAHVLSMLKEIELKKHFCIYSLMSQPCTHTGRWRLRAEAWESARESFNPSTDNYQLYNLEILSNLSKPEVIHVKHGDNRYTFFTGMLWGFCGVLLRCIQHSISHTVTTDI